MGLSFLINKENACVELKIFSFKISFKYKPVLAAIICVRNEEYYLPTFLKHLENYVDFVVAVDDGSTDNTYEILNSHPLCKEVIKLPSHSSKDWDEVNNRKLVMDLAKKHVKKLLQSCKPAK